MACATRATRIDTYSRLEADAVAYAVSKGVAVVAAVGNADQAPPSHGRMRAGRPLFRTCSASVRFARRLVPAFSNRDPTFNDIAAPGEEILSTFPLPLTERRPACLEQGYSCCGSEEYTNAEGTTFAAPQVSAAVALLATLPRSCRTS